MNPKDKSSITIFQLTYHICSLIMDTNPINRVRIHDIRQYTASCTLQQDMLVEYLAEGFNWSTPAVFTSSTSGRQTIRGGPSPYVPRVKPGSNGRWVSKEVGIIYLSRDDPERITAPYSQELYRARETYRRNLRFPPKGCVSHYELLTE